MDKSWWVLPSETLMQMLLRCYNGEDPDMVYIEEYVNCVHEKEEE